MSARVLVVIPASWAGWPPAQTAWVAELLRELDRRWGVVAAFDPGFPEEGRRVPLFARRAWNDFLEQCKEAVFEQPVEALVAVGAAAKTFNLQCVAGWAPLARRICLFTDADLQRLRDPDARGLQDLTDLAIHQGEWRGAAGFSTAFAGTPAEACDAIESRCALRWVQSRSQGGAEGLSVVLGPGRGCRLPPGARVVRVLPARRHGPPEVARWNDAAKRARGEFILFLAGDVQVAPFGIARLLEYFELDPSLAAVGALAVHEPSRDPRLLLAAHSLAGRGHREHARQLESSCWVVRRGAWLRAGMLDPELLAYPMAVRDYSLRLRQAGFRIARASDVAVWRKSEPGRSPSQAEAFERLQRKWGYGSVIALGELLRSRARREME